MMSVDKKIKLFLVDETGEICLKSLSHNPDVVILDYYLDSHNKKAMNGIEILDKIKAFNPGIPVIMLSAQDKIEVAVNCMHHNTFDYIVKSETAFVHLRKAIATIIRIKETEKALSWYMDVATK
ncbi:MAG: response regulator [Paludibacteraceae bacterium]|nr:response regulator [Paludibacteraceae bacterium]